MPATSIGPPRTLHYATVSSRRSVASSSSIVAVPVPMTPSVTMGGASPATAKRASSQLEAVAGREIKRGRKRLAIFYGAAHMPDMESRLVKKMHFKKQSVRYLKAWDLRDQANRKADST